MFTEKLVVEAGVNLMVGRVSCKGRHCSKESRRSQGVWYLWHMCIRLQQLASQSQSMAFARESITPL